MAGLRLLKGEGTEMTPDIPRVAAVPLGLLMEQVAEYEIRAATFVSGACRYLLTGRSGPYEDSDGAAAAYFSPAAEKGLTAVRIERFGERGHWVPEGRRPVETGYWTTDLSELVAGLQRGIA